MMALTIPTKLWEIAGIVLIVGVWALIGLTFSKSQMPVLSQPPLEHSLSGMSTDFLKALPTFDQYEANLNKRDLFGFGMKIPVSLGDSVALPSGQLPSNFKVVGIVLGQDPEVVIEDTQGKQVFFVTKSKPQSGFEIQKVETVNIIISYQGQSIVVPLNERNADNSISFPGVQNSFGQQNVPFPFSNQ